MEMYDYIFIIKCKLYFSDVIIVVLLGLVENIMVEYGKIKYCIMEYGIRNVVKSMKKF